MGRKCVLALDYDRTLISVNTSEKRQRLQGILQQFIDFDWSIVIVSENSQENLENACQQMGISDKISAYKPKAPVKSLSKFNQLLAYRKDFGDEWNVYILLLDGDEKFVNRVNRYQEDHPQGNPLDPLEPYGFFGLHVDIPGNFLELLNSWYALANFKRLCPAPRP